MASQDLSARLRYLNESAHLLATSAPATSKFLMSKCNSLMFDNELEQPESQRQKICGACGTIMILGWDATLKIESRRPRRGKSTRDGLTSNQTNQTRAMVYKCESCGRNTRLIISPPTAKRRYASLSSTKYPSDTTQKSDKTMLSTTPLPPPAKSNTSTPSASSSSKKRAKSRKQGGLEAILARQRTVESRNSGFGLDLMDFMKKP